MPDVQQVLDQINGIVASTTAIIAMVTPLVVKLWKLLTVREDLDKAKERNERVNGTLDTLERVTRTNVNAIEQTEGKRLRDSTGTLTPEGRTRLKELAYQAIRHDYGSTFADTARKLDFTEEQLTAHVQRLIEAVVFQMRAQRPPPPPPTPEAAPASSTSPSSLPTFGGLTAAELMARGAPVGTPKT